MVIHALMTAAPAARPSVSAAPPSAGDGYAGTVPERLPASAASPSPAWTLAGMAYEHDARKLQATPRWESLPPTQIALRVLNQQNVGQVLEFLGTEEARWARELIDQRAKDAEGNDHLKSRLDRERVAMARAVLTGAPVLATLEDPTEGLVNRMLDRLGAVPARAVTERLKGLVEHPCARLGLDEAALMAPGSTDPDELIALALPRCGSRDGIALGRQALPEMKDAVASLRAAYQTPEGKDFAERTLYVKLAPLRHRPRAEQVVAAVPVLLKAPALLESWLADAPDYPLGPLLTRMKDVPSQKRLLQAARDLPPDTPAARLRLFASVARGGGPDRAVLQRAWDEALSEQAAEQKDFPALGTLARDSFGCSVAGARALIERGLALSSGPLTPVLQAELAQLASDRPSVEKALAQLEELGKQHAELSRPAETSAAIRIDDKHVQIGGVRLGRKERERTGV